MKVTQTDYFSYGLALLLALLVHAGVIGMMTLNFDDSHMAYTEIKPYYIEAAMVAENPYTAPEKRKVEQAEIRREQRLATRRETEARLRREQLDWEKQQKLKALEAAKAPPVEVEATRQPPVVEPVSQEPETEDMRTAFEESLALALTREENARKAVTDDEKAMAYVAQMQREIGQNWSRPPSARNGMQTILRVRLIPTGEVIDVTIEDSSGNDSFDRSATLAVRKAGRFVVPAQSAQFEKYFREFTVLFRPDDLRL